MKMLELLALKPYFAMKNNVIRDVSGSNQFICFKLVNAFE